MSEDKLRSLLQNDEMEALIEFLDSHPNLDLNEFTYLPFDAATDLSDTLMNQKAFQTEQEEFIYLEEKSIRLLKLLETYGYDVSRLSSALFIELGAQYDRHIYDIWPDESYPYLGVIEYLLKIGWAPNTIRHSLRERKI